MNPFYMMNVIQQVQQIRQNPTQLASLLQQRGIISGQQAQDIKEMGNNYSQIGQYLINAGTMPTNIPQNAIDQAQIINGKSAQ